MLDQKSILIVEDNVCVAMDLAMAVEDLGGSVVGPVGRVDEAMTLLAAHQVSGAVLDCQLEDRDITPIAMFLVERGVPLVIHTGTGLPPALARAHPDLPVLTKPLKPAIVLAFLMGRMHDSSVGTSAKN